MEESKAGSFWLRRIRTKFPNPKSFGGIYEKEIAKSAHNKPPEREINFFGGLLDVYIALFWQFFNCHTAIGICLIKLKISP
jgi:hypothetical protein